MRIPVPDELLPAEALGRVHFVGIGGAGLSGIARIMAARGLPVTGSDDHDTPFLPGPARARRPLPPGLRRRRTSPDADTVVVTTAAREDNPEVAEARRLGLRMLPRSAGLWSVMAGRRVRRRRRHARQDHHHVAAHRRARGRRRRPDVRRRRRARPRPGATPTRASGDLFVAEADESDGAFLVYRPVCRRRHQRRGRPPRRVGHRGGLPPGLRRLRRHRRPRRLPGVLRRRPRGARPGRAGARRAAVGVVTVGRGRRRRRARDPASRSRRDTSASRWSRVTASTSAPSGCASPGATTSWTRSRRWSWASSSATTSRGSARVSSRSSGPGVGWRPRARPAACASTTAMPITRARSRPTSRPRVPSPAPAGCVVVFQPHLVSRTRIFGPAMGVALGAADEVVVLDVYLAREQPDAGGHGRAGRRRRTPARRSGSTAPPASPRPRTGGLALARPGDLVLTLGAGDVTTVGPRRPGPARGVAPMPSLLRSRGSKPTDVADTEALRTPAPVRPAPVASSLAELEAAPRRSCSSSRCVVGGVWVVFFSRYLAVQGVQVSGTGLLSADDVRRAAARPGRRAARPGRPGRHRAPGRVAGARRRRDRDPAVAGPAAASSSPSGSPWPWSTSAAGSAGWTTSGVVFRDYPRAPRNLPARPDERTHRGRGAARGRPGRLLAPARPGPTGRAPRGRDRRPDHPGPARRPPGPVGERGGVRRRRRSVLVALLKEPAASYDVSVPGQPTTSQSIARTLTSASACRRLWPGACVPTVLEQHQVDITITLRLTVRVPSKPRGRVDRVLPHEPQHPTRSAP